MNLIGEVEKYQHVERFGSSSVEGLLDKNCVVQEKLDGANLTVANEAGLIVATRNSCIHHDGAPLTGFRGAVEYVLAHEGILDFITDHPELVLRGEWLIKNRIDYGPLNMFKYYVFDVQLRDGNYIPWEDYSSLLAEYDILMVPHLGFADSMDEVIAFAGGESAIGGDRKEGVVVKRYDFANKYGQIVWGKFVNEEYHQTPRIRTECNHEAAFADYAVSVALVNKVMDKLEGDISIRRLGEIIGRSWDDVVHEELAEFVLHNKIRNFNFFTAKKEVTNLVRQIAMDRFNGI